MRFRLTAAIAATALASLAATPAAHASPVPPNFVPCNVNYASHVFDPPPDEPHTPMPYDCGL